MLRQSVHVLDMCAKSDVPLLMLIQTSGLFAVLSRGLCDLVLMQMCFVSFSFESLGVMTISSAGPICFNDGNVYLSCGFPFGYGLSYSMH